MRSRKNRIALLLLGVAMFLSSNASAQIVQQMNLNDITDRAEKIFRGMVLNMTVGTVEAGGAELPTVSYNVQIVDGIKGLGDAGGDYGGGIISITMYGSVKGRPVNDGVEYLGGFQPELLDVGGEYLLFMTRPSGVGLSTMVGLGQGAFKVLMRNKEDYVVNGVNNQGLFRGIDRGNFPQDGPINYEALATRIRAELTN
jgi:hypothetical protein